VVVSKFSPNQSEKRLIGACPKIRFIYELQYHPLFETSWVYGGEYEEFARIVTLVVRMWVAVGLQVHFVLDGTSFFDAWLVHRLTVHRSVPFGQV
jgi:hypothetical protein